MDPACSVTVLEAGIELSDPTLAAQAADATRLPIGPASPLVRRYATQLTDRAKHPVTIVRGCTIGGSGAVNGGYFCRARPGDFDGFGLPGWRWPTVLDHFRAIETDLDVVGAAHGGSGPIPVRRTAEIAASTAQFVSRAQRAGFDWIADLNDPAAGAGVGAVPLNIVDGVRTGPGAAYLLPALRRPNLTVLTEFNAVRVEIVGGRAVALAAVGPHGPVRLAAERIILCAGAIGSAKLLMLSGVGGQQLLGELGIEVVADLPVGLHCADHPEWLVPAGWEALPGRAVLEAVLHTAEGVELRPYTSGFAAMVGECDHAGPQLGVALMRPRARGRLTLVSPDPAVPPRIEHRYDSEPADLADLRRGVELASEITRSATTAKPVWSTSQHLCGSAPMGAETDQWAVLDEQCRVRGVEGLWVIDGSALPGIPSRGPHATIAMLAHRAAEFVRA